MFNLAGFGALGFGFTMNLGGNREGGPQFQMGFSFLPLLIGGIVTLMATLGEYLPAGNFESSSGGYIPSNSGSRSTHRSSYTGGSRTRTNPNNRVRAPPAHEESGFFEYIFYTIYITVIISFIGYAFFQRNRQNVGRA